MPSMPSAPVGQGLQSCLEPRQAHPLKKNPQVHRWVAPPCSSPPVPDHPSSKCEKGNGAAAAIAKEVGGGGGGGWNSFYSLSQPSQSPLDAIDNSSYKIPTPPPPTKCPRFLEKNLELITENLGCETGVAFSIQDFPIDGYPCGGLEAESEEPARGPAMAAAKMSKRRVPSEFPPPLTTLYGGDPIRLRSKREDGRLLLVRYKPTLFEAERKDGRLRLRLLSIGVSNSRDEAGEAEQRESRLKAEEGQERGAEERAQGREAEGRNARVRGEGGAEGEAGGEVEEEGDYLGVVGKEMNGCNGGAGAVAGGGDEAGSGKYRRAGRCMEEEVGGPRLMTTMSNAIFNWDAFWVASS